MKLGNSEIKNKPFDSVDNSVTQDILKNARKFLEWDTDCSVEESKNCENVYSGKKTVDEAWKSFMNEIHENQGIKAVDNYISKNHDCIVDAFQSNNPEMALSDILDILYELKITDLVETIVYFYLWKYNLVNEALGYMGQLFDTEPLSFLNIGGVYFVEEIDANYYDILTPSYIKKYYNGEDILPDEKLIAKLVQTTEQGIEAACYISSKLIIGIGEVTEDAVDFVIAGAGRLAGKKDIGNYLFNHQFTTRLSESVEQSFQGNENIKEIGNIIEKAGEIGTYIALGILATGASSIGGVPIAVAACATTLSGLAKAGKMTKALSEISGEISEKELLYGLGVGILNVVCMQSTAFMVRKIDEATKGAIDEIMKSGVDYAGAKALREGVKGALLSGAASGAIFSTEDVYKDIISNVMDESMDRKNDWKNVIKDVAFDTAEGAAMGILSYAVGETVTDIIDMKNYEGDLNWKERIQIKLETGWDNRIIKYIKTMEEYGVYKDANLHQEIINNRLCLCKDIDWDYVDPKTGMTNRQRVEHIVPKTGRPAPLSPIDSKTGEKIELHHMGQSVDAPLVELAENSEHGDGNDSILHDKTKESWRRNPENRNQYQKDKRNHWIKRGSAK